MNKVGIFEKVSFKQYCEAFGDTDDVSLVREIYDNIKLPTRATTGSAGYDFFAPYEICLKPGETVKVPTGIRVKVDEGWWLGCFPRSGLGFKYRLQLDNTVGVIDSDYYYSDNEGHIFEKITNDSKNNKTVIIHSGEAFAQAIFIPYGITYDDNATGIRNGGFGSTTKKVMPAE